ncbi:MAG: hypothetical protein ACI4JC_07975 [Faecalibacterium sp.]
MKRTAGVFLAACMLVLLAGCTQAKLSQEVLELEAQGVYTLSSGESVDRWRGYLVEQESGAHLPEPQVKYCLADGTQLLTEQNPAGLSLTPELEEPTRNAIQKWYQQRGAWYELQGLLEAANAAYQKAPEAFQPWYVGQETIQTAQNDKTVWCMSEVTIPLGGTEATSWQVGAVFDRENGEKKELWSLFKVSEQRAKEVLLTYVGQEDPLKARMLEALTPEMVTFYPDHATVYFPLGSLTGEQTPVAVQIPMEELAVVLRPWAVPQAENSAA